MRFPWADSCENLRLSERRQDGNPLTRDSRRPNQAPANQHEGGEHISGLLVPNDPDKVLDFGEPPEQPQRQEIEERHLSPRLRLIYYLVEI